ncbi:peptidoglycan recognition protein family protein [Synechocystis sp. PCC 7509]|uniref:peptidoglycan recognition protein family protein n=1 Tax=Synechocystis sp. PCC 7509 TaxID=927677 RepID=UPI0002AC1ADD|nr:peptidoglycan recognition family protein [Synechocystis sp. PCC 7509]
MRGNTWIARGLLIFSQLAALIIVVIVGQKPQENQAITSMPAIVTIPIIPPEKVSKTTSSHQINKVEFVANYQPRYEISWAHPNNYGQRYTQNVNGLPVNNQSIVVIHETVNSAASAINNFQTPHTNENAQVSYHALIKLDGTVVYIVPPQFRAFGAGNSVFRGAKGIETVKTHLQFPPSVNNFAYHVAFETPPDGRNNRKSHSGYTQVQYNSLAWLIAQSRVPEARITTHKAVDRSGSRIDPRSFDINKFFRLLKSYR